VDRETVDRLQELTIVSPSLSPVRLHRVEYFDYDLANPAPSFLQACPAS
jgi:hypothetical protein